MASLEPPPAELKLTGERTLPGIPDETYWFERHVVAYRWATRWTGGRTVLDAGCGEGYGLALLAGAGARRVLGVDLDPQVVAHAERTYRGHHPQLGVIEADLVDLPLAEDIVDVVVSFQVVEHLRDVPTYLAELRRVLRPSGVLLLATPNRLTFTPQGAPANPFHVTEYTAAELRATLVGAGFAVNRLTGVHHGWRLRLMDRFAGGSLTGLLAAPPQRWPAWLRAAVHRVRADWFELRDNDLDASLDLLVGARARP